MADSTQLFSKRALRQWDQAIEGLSETNREGVALFHSLMSNAFTGELTADWEAESAEWITRRQELLDRLPQLVLLAFLDGKVQRMGGAAEVTAVLVTALMKYAFLLQMEGASRGHLYHFVPYHYGPFAKNLYDDLKILQDDDLVNVENGDEHRTRITLSDRERVAEALAELPEEVQEDIDAILDTYGDLDHNKLLKTVYKKYPAYARKSRLHRTRPR